MLVDLGALLRLLVLLGHRVQLLQEVGRAALFFLHLLLDREHLSTPYLVLHAFQENLFKLF